jgi:uncharacterized cupin superfamily protein
MTDVSILPASINQAMADLFGPLQDTGPRLGADSGAPMTGTRTLLDAGALQCGIWECTPGGWSITDRSNTEVVHILRGAAQITDADGTVHQLRPGSVHVFPLGWSGRWDIAETIRKVYVTVEGL